jgi:replicative DNA helicase
MNVALIPQAPEAERSVVGQVMRGGHRLAGRVVGTLEFGDFHDVGLRTLYQALYDAYYADEPLDALSIGEATAPRLTKLWHCPEQDVLARVAEIERSVEFAGDVVDHAKLIKIAADRRGLLRLADSIKAEVAREEQTPEQIAGMASQTAMQLATSTLITREVVSFGDMGRELIPEIIQQRKLRLMGIETGAYFGLPFLDNYMKGLKPTEMLIVAGEPGAGKSAVMWTAALRFAERQMRKPPDRRVGALVLSLEMGMSSTNARLAQTITGIEGSRLREARVTDMDIQAIKTEWGKRKEIPLWFNFASTLRASQLRALIVDAILHHNIGLVVIDHFKHWHLDKRLSNPVQEDEEKAEFLSQQIAKDLNVAVICIAHTTKGIEQSPDRRPQLTHLRGSYQVAAHADFVAFVYRPYKYADENTKMGGKVRETDAEMIYRKSRHSFDGIVPFYFDAVQMRIQ